MNDNSVILEIKGLNTSFKKQEGENLVVQDLHLTLRKGEILGIVGESGSGKSVTVLSVLKLLPTKTSSIKGEINFADKNLVDLTEDEIRKYRGNKISMIFQEPMSSLNPTMRLGAQVQEMIEIHSSLKGQEAKAKVLELFKKVKLDDPERFYKSYPHQASGGQLQRIMIAMAISSDPEILIADEPTTALDVTVANEILELLKSIQKELNTATIFISHDLHLVKNLCDHVIVMKDGKIVESGETSQVFNQPDHPYTKGLLNCRPQSNFHLSRLPTVENFLNDEVPTSLKREKQEFNTIILEAENLKKYFPLKKNWLGKPVSFTKAVDGVNLSIREGEILGLVGESGCGKSTLGKILSNQILPDEGTVMFGGKNIIGLNGEELRKHRTNVQMIFQNPFDSLNPRMKIGEAILEPILSHKLLDRASAKKRVYELLSQTGLLQEHYDRYPREFSGGQRQRISIARALSISPKVLICDESIAALDVSIQAQIINLLLDLRDQLKLSILFISHDLASVRFICDNIAVMYNGKIVEVGNAADVYDYPKHPYTQKLLASVNF